jgi:hypothetical protein
VKRTVGGMPVFIVMIVILVGVLQLVNWIPSAVQEGAFARFRSAEEVRAKLKIDPLLMPVYYPRSIAWPPSLIAAQSRPYPAVVTEFLRSDGAGTGLVITQTEKGHAPLQERIRLSNLRERVEYPLKGRTAVLEVGACGSGEICSRLAWNEGPFQMTLTMLSSPVDVLAIAESMIPDGAGTPSP